MNQMKTTAVNQSKSPVAKRDRVATDRATFFVAFLNMSWQLAIAVLVPIIGGVMLDKKLGTPHVFLFVGLALALLGTVLVLWRTMQEANKLPVPKLTDAQRREIQRQYEEDDD